MTAKRPTIGQRCTVKAIAGKARDYPDNGDHYPNKSRWYTAPIRHAVAYYIGYRVVSEGTVDLKSYADDEYPVYIPTKFHTVWLFVYNERSTPIYAFPEDVEWEPSGGD